MRTKDDPRLTKKNLINIVILFAVFLIMGVIIAVVYAKTEIKNPNAAGGSTAICFNEIMLSNKGTLVDPAGSPSDWIELYNDADIAADIGGYVILNGDVPFTIESNTVIEPRGYLIIYCVGANRGGLFAPFTLSKAGGETLVLKNREGMQLDTVKTFSTSSNESLIPVDDAWQTTTLCTPGYSNDEAGYSALTASRKGEASSVVINEFMASNELTIADEDGLYFDWIEVKNNGQTAVNLRNYSLSDDGTAPYKWQFPDINLNSGQCILIFASEKDTKSGELHANFKLKAAGGSVVLASNDGKIIDSFSYDTLEKSCSYARSATGEFMKTYEPTPGFDNTDYNGFASVCDKNKNALVINEAMSKNNAYLKQNGGKYYDWIELKNVSDSAINLRDYYLSTDVNETAMWQLPDVELAPGKLYVVVASGSEILSNRYYKHTNFKINDEEQLFLFSSDGILIDGMCLKATPINYSLGRVSGEKGFFYISNPTPEDENNSGTRAVTSTPTINTKGGVYNNVESVSVMATGEGTLYYTLDGSEPTKNSSVLNGELNLNSTKVLRVASYAEGKLKSETASASYIINENNNLPVMSVALNPEDMYGYTTGIYVKGPGASSEPPYEGANFWQDWEKQAHADFFEEGRDGFSIPCGLKI
ncbi:MAG: hypothetical protein DBX47_02710, partial [Clostridiales bacterium]